MRRLLVLWAACGPQTATPITASSPKPTGGLVAVQIATAANHTCARMSDGTVRCWGDNGAGEVGAGPKIDEQHTPLTVKNLTGAIDVQLGLAESCVRLENGETRCWGSLTFIDIEERRDTEDSRDFAPKRIAWLQGADRFWLSHTGAGCARWTKQRETKCWGTGGVVLATGKQDFGIAPTRVIPALEDAIDFSVGESLGCAVMKDKTARCFGVNQQGQVGDGTTEMRLQPVPVKNLANVEQIAVLREAACARLTDGSVKCWGANDWGQVGDGTTVERHMPTDTKLKDVVHLSAASVHVCALHRDATVTCWGNNRQGELGDGHDYEHRNKPRPGMDEDASPPVKAKIDRVRQIVTADFHTCALRDDGTVWCWGSGQRGSLGDGFAADRRVPTQVKWELAPVVSAGLSKGLHVKSVVAGNIHTCAVLSDGSVRCWGRNDRGMVDATGKSGEHLRPVAVPGVTNATAVTLAIFGSAARLTDGSIVSWGGGNGVEKVPMKPVTEYISGGMMACARRDDDITRCGDHTDIFEIGATAAVGVNHAFACVLLKNTTVACGGYNGKGQLGDGTTTERNKFAPVKHLKDVVQIAVGGDHACARLASGKVWCWGDGDVVGNGKDGPQETPVEVFDGAIDIVAGGSSTCARKQSGAVSCWGHYGTQTMTAPRDKWYSDKPRVVPWLAGAQQISLGGTHHCALFAGDKLKCWGENTAGQLGDGTMTTAETPVDVKW